jgi:hypothetical protein
MDVDQELPASQLVEIQSLGLAPLLDNSELRIAVFIPKIQTPDLCKSKVARMLYIGIVPSEETMRKDEIPLSRKRRP